MIDLLENKKQSKKSTSKVRNYIYSILKHIYDELLFYIGIKELNSFNKEG